MLSLRERYQKVLKSGRIQSSCSPSVDDVVLVKENAPRGCWKLGKVTELVTSRDECIRSARVLLPSGRIIGRPLNLLCPMEVSHKQGKEFEKCDVRQPVSSKKESALRPTRQAAQQAKIKIKESLSN